MWNFQKKTPQNWSAAARSGVVARDATLCCCSPTARTLSEEHETQCSIRTNGQHSKKMKIRSFQHLNGSPTEFQERVKAGNISKFALNMCACVGAAIYLIYPLYRKIFLGK
jgi:hypothetical protein